MKILHTGDLHVTEGPRLADDARVLAAIVDSGREAGVGLWIVGGDLSGTTVPHRMTPAERNLLADSFLAMADVAPVAIVYGNHDFPGDLYTFGRLNGKHRIVVADRPMVAEFRRDGRRLGGRDSSFGPIFSGPADVDVYLLPYPSKRFLLADAVAEGIEGQKATAEEHLRTIIGLWRDAAATADPIGPPRVFVGHINIGGSLVAGGEVMLGQEIELSIGDLQDMAGFDYFALSHIHKAQEIAPRAFYAGSPTGHNFGETDPKGWNIAEVGDRSVAPAVARVDSPARRFVTVRAETSVDAAFGDSETFVLRLPEREAGWAAGAEVRLLVAIPEEFAATADVDGLVETIRAEGAFAVTVDRTILPRVRVRSEAVQAAATTREAVEAFLREGDDPPGEDVIARVLGKFDRLDTAEI